jgi:RHS repeat-associated protein
LPAIVLIITALMAASLPPTIAASVVRDAASGSVSLLDRFGSFAIGWLTKKPRKGKKGSPQELSVATGTKPQPPPTKSEKEARVSSIRISPKDDIVLESGKSILFSAVPVDIEGAAVQGLSCEWTTSDKGVVTISKTGEALGGKPGRATITAAAGQVTQSKVVNVVEAMSGEFGPPKPKSTRKRKTATGAAEETSAGTNAEKRRHHLSSFIPPLRPVDEDPLPDDETVSLYNLHNVVGSPPGQTIPGGLTPSVAASGTEHGNQNFTFALPVVGMSGRGLGVSLGLVYNSQVWNKSEDGGSGTWMTYDVDSGWPSPGFRLGFGQIENQSDSFTLTDPDGTRHALVISSTDNYDTTDGTFIHYYGGSVSGTLNYPDGTVVTYGAGGGGYRLYPTKITDRNGNYITIAYHGTSGAGPQIESIQDTLDRYVNFYYASNGDLITVTMPGLTGPLQVMRFYYEDVTISNSFLFDNSIDRDPPSTVHALKYVYLPASSDGTSPIYTGYKFDYSCYGMIYRSTQYRGMTVSTNSTASPGSVTYDGSMAGQTTYNYPTTNSSLTDVPTYTMRTDEWAGRTSGGSAPVYTFANSTGTGDKISTVTAPDGTITETHTIDHPEFFDDGLVSDTYVQYGSTPTVLAHTHLDWDHDSNNHNHRVSQIRTTDVQAGLTKATVLTYSEYNNVSVVSERDFTTDGTVSSTELRKTETDYVDSSNYLNRHLFHLPSQVRIVQGGSSFKAARVDYTYDNYGSSHGDMTGRSDIIRHDPAFDPFGSSYNSATDYRGNVTSVTTYTDANGGSGSITHSSTYDIAGSVMTAEVDCCQLKSFTYSGAGSGALHDYSEVISVTSGNPNGIHFTTYAEFDQNTGLPASATDENSTVTEYAYNSGSLRLSEVEVRNSSSVLQADTAYSYLDGTGTSAYVMVRTKLDSSRNVDSYRFFDGRGAVVRTFGKLASDNYVTQDIQYDAMGRAYRASNPYYASSFSATVNPDGFWTTSTFDHLGRVTEVTMPRGDDNNTYLTSVTTAFDGVYTTVTDQAGKLRRQKVDALGRVIRLDEPTTSGLGSQSLPNQATSYEYDLLDNLVHITQGDQNRYFKYDSLSRLIRENQVEQETTSLTSSYDLTDSWNTGGHWTRKIAYNSSGLVTDAYDARGVHTTFSYDDLNRVTQISYSDSTPTSHYYYDSQSLPSGAPSTSSPDSYSRTYTAGRLVAMTYGTGATGTYFDYDATGRVTKQFQITGSGPTKYKLLYDYNYAGLLTSETYPTGRALAYAYDDGGRLSSVGDGTTTFANSLTYAAHGGLTSETFGNSMVHGLDYNRRLQAKQITLKQNSSATTPLQQYDYGYGEFNTSTGNVDTSKNNGQIGKVTATIGTTAQWNQGFSYDELGRLSSFAEHAGSAMTTTNYSHSYSYDRYGNRTQSANSTLGLVSVLGTDYDTTHNNNRFVSSVASYDEAGNILTDAKFRALKYTYDANGRQNTVKALDDTPLQSSVYDSAGQRIQTTAGSVTRTMVYDVFGQDVAEYLGASLDRENIYRGGQLFATEAGTPSAAAPSSLATTTNSTGTTVSLSWSSASGAGKYRVERKSAGGNFALLATTTSTSLTDTSVSNGSAYLYKVCSADNQDNCTSSYSNLALGTAVTFTDATICAASDSPSCSPLTDIKAAHITELQTAINAVRSLAGASGYSWTYSVSTGSTIHVEDVRDLRTALDYALSTLNLQTSSYTDNTLVGYSENPLTATTIKAVHIREIRLRVTNNVGTTGSGGSGAGLVYVLSDLQGSTRAVMSGSAIAARHDYLPFGEEIGSGIGSRTLAQGYNASDGNRWKYAMTERDATSGLDHTWFRNYEAFAGRWTSPDPYRGSMSLLSPHSFNRYAYAHNDPINFLDPTGLNDYGLGPPPPVPILVPYGGTLVTNHSVPLDTLDFGLSDEELISWFDNPKVQQKPIPAPHPTPTPPPPVDPKRSEWELDKCDLAVLGHYLKKDTVTALKQQAANAGVGLAVLGALFFGAEAAEAVVGVVSIELIVSVYVKLEATTRAIAFGTAALVVAVKTYGSLIKEGYNNKKELIRGLRQCAADHAPLTGQWREFMDSINPWPLPKPR